MRSRYCWRGMTRDLITVADLAARVLVGDGPDDLAGPLVQVDLDSPTDEVDVHRVAASLRPWPGVILGIGAVTSPAAPLVDVIAANVDDPARHAVSRTVGSWPQAASALAALLRSADDRSLMSGLVAESATYSMLQAGPEFGAWLRSRRAGRPSPPDAPIPDPSDLVVATQRGGAWELMLQRPERHNALDRHLRAALHDALRTADASGATMVVLRGAGPSFCSGGDLDEFGSFEDPVQSHLTRLRRHPAAALMALGRDRVSVDVHGACVGSGVELAAFAGTVRARPDAWFRLPEVTFGLVPGSGGTVSLPRRIGRHRTAAMALTGEPVDVATALEWGLVDAVI